MNTPTPVFDYDAAVQAWEVETAELMATFEVPWTGVNFAGVES